MTRPVEAPALIRSLRSGRVYEAVEIDGDLLVSIVTPAPGDGCRRGETFVLDHRDIELLAPAVGGDGAAHTEAVR